MPMFAQELKDSWPKLKYWNMNINVMISYPLSYIEMSVTEMLSSFGLFNWNQAVSWYSCDTYIICAPFDPEEPSYLYWNWEFSWLYAGLTWNTNKPCGFFLMRTVASNEECQWFSSLNKNQELGFYFIFLVFSKKKMTVLWKCFDQLPGSKILIRLWNTGLSSTQYEQIPIILGVWTFWLTLFFFRSITFWRAYG